VPLEIYLSSAPHAYTEARVVVNGTGVNLEEAFPIRGLLNALSLFETVHGKLPSDNNDMLFHGQYTSLPSADDFPIPAEAGHLEMSRAKRASDV
jgi:hypothetical protein